MTTSSTDAVEEKINIKAPAVIFLEGEASDSLFVLETGEIKVFKENQGRLIPVAILGPKEFLGEAGLFSDDKRSATAIASKDSVIIKLKADDIKLALNNVPDWGQLLMTTLSERLKKSTNVLKDHKISGISSSGEALLPQEESKYIKLIADYKKQKEIKT